ncbi:hypothetical protein ACFSS8_09965 [Paracoccus kondratievae]
MIVEPARGYLMIFAGLAQVFGETGDVLAAGEPVGLMGGQEPPRKSSAPSLSPMPQPEVALDRARHSMLNFATARKHWTRPSGS